MLLSPRQIAELEAALVAVVSAGLFVLVRWLNALRIEGRAARRRRRILRKIERRRTRRGKRS
jgi:hypothetical protein